MGGGVGQMPQKAQRAKAENYLLNQTSQAVGGDLGEHFGARREESSIFKARQRGRIVEEGGLAPLWVGRGRKVKRWECWGQAVEG